MSESVGSVNPSAGPGRCDACGGHETKGRTNFECQATGLTKAQTLALCRSCTRLTVQVQKRLERSRLRLGIK